MPLPCTTVPDTKKLSLLPPRKSLPNELSLIERKPLYAHQLVDPQQVDQIFYNRNKEP